MLVGFPLGIVGRVSRIRRGLIAVYVAPLDAAADQTLADESPPLPPDKFDPARDGPTPRRSSVKTA
jgi:hypothetical protein